MAKLHGQKYQSGVPRIFSALVCYGTDCLVRPTNVCCCCCIESSFFELQNRNSPGSKLNLISGICLSTRTAARMLKLEWKRKRVAGSRKLLLMGLHHLQMAWLVPDDSLLRFSQLKISFIHQNQTSSILDKCCHLRLCLHLIEHNF